MSDTLIVEQGRERKYFTMLPNMVMNLELSPFAIALYCRIRWRAGEDGVCYENTRHLAGGCQMSAAQVSRAKKELEAAGLIKITTQPGKHGGRAYHLMTIVDIWPDNMRRCSQGEPSSFPEKLASFYQEPNKNPLNNLGKNLPEKINGVACDSTQPRDSAENGSLPSNSPEEKQGAAERASPSACGKTSHASSEYNGERNDEFNALRKHPAIQAIKQVTGYYPKRSKNLYERLIKELGEEPDIEKMGRCFGTWCQKGYNPQNYEWVFEWYPNDMYYVIGAIRA